MGGPRLRSAERAKGGEDGPHGNVNANKRKVESGSGPGLPSGGCGPLGKAKEGSRRPQLRSADDREGGILLRRRQGFSQRAADGRSDVRRVPDSREGHGALPDRDDPRKFPERE